MHRVFGLTLKKLDWRVIRVWECDIRKVVGREEYLDRLYDTITKPLPSRGYDSGPDTIPMAAEPESDYGANQ